MVFVVRYYTWGAVSQQRLFCLLPSTMQGKHCQKINTSVPLTCYPLWHILCKSSIDTDTCRATQAACCHCTLWALSSRWTEGQISGELQRGLIQVALVLSDPRTITSLRPKFTCEKNKCCLFSTVCRTRHFAFCAFMSRWKRFCLAEWWPLAFLMFYGQHMATGAILLSKAFVLTFSQSVVQKVDYIGVLPGKLPLLQSSSWVILKLPSRKS